MELLNTILGNSGAGVRDQLASRFGLDRAQIDKALEHLVPALGAGVKRNTQSPGGLASLLGSLQSNDHERYLDHPELAQEDATAEEGNKILGHLFGNKEVSRDVAQQTSEKTGIDVGIIKQLLPYAATMVMGALSKKKGQASSEGGDATQGLLGLLDSDGDGSVTDDAMGLLKKLF